MKVELPGSYAGKSITEKRGMESGKEFDSRLSMILFLQGRQEGEPEQIHDAVSRTKITKPISATARNEVSGN